MTKISDFPMARRLDDLSDEEAEEILAAAKVLLGETTSKAGEGFDQEQPGPTGATED
jgi:hypothetical protein